MNYLGSKLLESDRLQLRQQTMEEQKRLWEILMLEDVRKYYLIVPENIRKNCLIGTYKNSFIKNK